jgi:hypothetical protein
LEPLDQNKLQQMQDLGVTGTVSYPFLFGIGANSTLDEKMQYMERFADAFIR